MIAFLKVKDFAIIDELKVEFGDGFNVITGETGAGKSIIINALSTFMNQKVSSDVVRSNVRQAEVMGHFFSGNEEYILKRIVSTSGRSRAFLNDDPITLNKLEEVSDKLINIYGQNELHHLLDKNSYIGIIDDLLNLTGERNDLAEKVDRLRKVKTELDAKKREREGQDKEIALLEFQIEELERENLQEGEEEQIRERLKLLKDSEKIQKCLDIVKANLYGSESSAHVLFKEAITLVKPFANIESMEKLKGKVEALSYDIDDVVGTIKDIEKGLLYDSEELTKLDERLSRIHDLKNKYGKTYEDIKNYEQLANKRLAYLKGLTTNIEELEKAKDVSEAEVKECAEKLTLERKKGAARIEKAILGELRFLSMEGMRFTISITDKENIDQDGKDDIEFLISTNPGEPLKPLRKIASGGELSRIMLAIKSIIGGEETKTLIFDEIDAGIGGRVADLVGKRLKELAKKSQIVCITHLPQIAVYGDHHFLVEKHQGDKTTKTWIKKLPDQERVKEVARMLGGTTITEKTIQRAEEMIQSAQKSTY